MTGIETGMPVRLSSMRYALCACLQPTEEMTQTLDELIKRRIGEARCACKHTWQDPRPAMLPHALNALCRASEQENS